MSPTRRDVVRYALGVAVGGLGACRSEPAREREAERSGVADVVTGEALDAVVRPRVWADGMLWIDFREPLQVVAYVSMASRKVYVDRAFRDRASWLLRAHISVSTWHWRIPLHGDDPTVPISPGDEVREFEELDIELWVPGEPAFDDIRIVRGSRSAYRLSAACEPVEGSDGVALTMRDPIEVDGARGGVDDTVREDFHLLGTGSVVSMPCSSGTSGGVAGEDTIEQLVGWAVRPD